MLALVAHVALQRVELHLELLVLAVGLRLLAPVEDGDGEDDGDQQEADHRHGDDPDVVARRWLLELVLEHAQLGTHVTHRHLYNVAGVEY